MPVLKSSSTALHAERPVLAPGWLIALMAAMVCAILWLLYPRQDLERRLAETTESALSLNYVNNLLRSDPNNPQLRLLLAQRQMANGNAVEARATLQPALDSSQPEIHRDALWVLWELTYTEFQRTPEKNSDRRDALRQALREQLHALARETWTTAQQRRLAALAAQFNEPALGIALNSKLAAEQNTPRETAQYYEQAARQALAVSDYTSCAEFYLLARKATTEPQHAKRLYLAAVRALQSGNQPLAALELAEREVGVLADDPEILFFLTELARSAGRPDVADRYIRRLLRLALLRQWQSHTALASSPKAMNPEPSAAMQPATWRPTLAHKPLPTTAFDDGAQWLASAAAMVSKLPNTAPTLLRVADNAPRAAAPSPGLPFDEKIYALGFQVFLENRKLDDAWAVAQAAVQQNPGNLVWRERLAQVSEWTLRLDVALENWLAIARQTQKEEAWQAVLRLAPGQFDDAALVQALHHQLRRKPDDLPLIQALVQTYERLGEPQPALDYLQQHARTPATLEILAHLAERAGQPDIALQSWRRLLPQPGQATPERAMRAAVLALTQGRPDEGLAWLEAAQKQTPSPEVATDFWRLTGQLAESRQRAPLAIAAYRKLLETQDIDVGDYDGLIRMLLLDFPLEAAKVSAHAWERYHQPRHLLQALTLYSGRGHWDSFARLLKPLESGALASRDTLAVLWKSPEFLRLVGSWHQNQGRMAEARRLYEAGLRASPQSTDMQQALLWLFIDGNDTVSLRTLLATHEQQWSRSEDVHDALASSYQALSLPQTALDRYLTPRFKAHQNDFLWLMNYADALDQNQQADRAWRLRRHLLSHEWQTVREGQGGTRLTRAQARKIWLTDAGLDQTRRIARTRLMLTQRPGDAAIDVLRELLRLDRDARGNFSNAAAETAIGWLQDAGEYTAERGFLWHQYARSHSLRANRPLWAEITVALAENDRAASGQLLETFDERLPRYDRINAAAAAHDVRLAQTAAFETQNNQHDDAPLHLQLTENLLAFSDHAGTRVTAAQLGGMDEQRADAVLHLALSPRMALDLNFGSIRRQATTPVVIRTPPSEKLLEARLHWRHLDGETVLYAASRQGFLQTTPLQLSHEQRLDNRLSLQTDIGVHLPSEESLALRVAGMKSRAAASLRYQATRQDQFSLTHAGERYELQTGMELGSGQHSTLQYTHTYRQDAPSLEWSAFWSTHAYRRRDLAGMDPARLGVQGFLPPDTTELGPDYFLPDNFRFYGIELSTNMRYAQDYTRALRPFASISRTWHSRLGPGYGVRLGMAGSVWGVDHLSLTWGQSKSGIQAQGTTRDLQLTYRLHF